MSLNSVAGILEKLGRDDEAIEAMGAALKIVQALGEDVMPSSSEMARQAQRNYDGLKRVVARKREREL